MNEVLYYQAGQIATIVLNDACDNTPIITSMYDKDLKAIKGYPLPMIKLSNENNIYVAKFQIPLNIASVGTYIVIVKYNKNQIEIQKTYSIIINGETKKPSVVSV